MENTGNDDGINENIDLHNIISELTQSMGRGIGNTVYSTPIIINPHTMFSNIINTSNMHIMHNMDNMDNTMGGILERSMLETGGVQKKTDKEVLKNLPIVEVFSDIHHCAICQEIIGNGEKAVKLPCSGTPHYFCLGDEPEKCEGIIPWLEAHNTCPICRFELPEEKQEEKSEENTSDILEDPPPLNLPDTLRNYVHQLVQEEMSNIDSEGFDTREFQQAIQESLDSPIPDLED
jgi:hypothetical protein